MPATDDAALARLLDAYGTAVYESAIMHLAGLPDAHRHPDAARAALLAYLDRAYLRLPPPLDGEPVEMEEAPGDDDRRRR